MFKYKRLSQFVIMVVVPQLNQKGEWNASSDTSYLHKLRYDVARSIDRICAGKKNGTGRTANGLPYPYEYLIASVLSSIERQMEKHFKKYFDKNGDYHDEIVKTITDMIPTVSAMVRSYKKAG